MNDPSSELEQLLMEATKRTSSDSLSPEISELQTVFLRLGNLLEQEAKSIDAAPILIALLASRERSTQPPQLSWLGMLSLAASLLLMASLASWFAGRDAHSGKLQIARRVPVAETSTWDDDWDIRLETMQESISSVRQNRLSSTDAATSWLDAALQEVRGEISAESM